VDIHMAVTKVIQEARQSGVDEATKVQFEALMRCIEEEFEKPEGEATMQPVKDAVGVAKTPRDWSAQLHDSKGLIGVHGKGLLSRVALFQACRDCGA
jgi:hypothetical protein